MNTILKKYNALLEDESFMELSYNLLTDIVKDEVARNGKKNINTSDALKKLKTKTSKLKDAKFAFLLSHACYIPDYYPTNGSEETLYSKLVEGLVGLWGKRLAYKTKLQDKKSTMEDVTFTKGKNVVVCDAKSHRLGRSQKAPNVKDVIKTSEYLNWSSKYEKHIQLGGFATFPSLFEWAKGSAVHTYLTDKKNPILLIYNKHMALMLLFKKKKPNLLFHMFKTHQIEFPKKIKNKDKAKSAYEAFTQNVLLLTCSASDLDDFNKISKRITDDYIKFSMSKLNNRIQSNKQSAKKTANNLKLNQLRKKYVDLKTKTSNGKLERSLANIKKFRL